MLFSARLGCLFNVSQAMTFPTPESYARIGTLSSLYADTCQRSYIDYLLLSNQISDIGEVEYDEHLDELNLKHQIAGVQAIVFAGMCFEAAIYDFAAIHLGDKYVQEHLDKLDVLSKWIVVLRFVSGYELQKDQAPYASLKRLVAARNRLVHSKSEKFNFSKIQPQLDRLQKEEIAHEQDVHNAFRAIVLMSVELERGIGALANPLRSFNSKVTIFPTLPEILQQVVGDCYSIVSRAQRVANPAFKRDAVKRAP